jgi:hypothetical protein
VSGDMVTCKVCGFVGHPREVEWHKPHCQPPKPWTQLEDLNRQPGNKGPDAPVSRLGAASAAGQDLSQGRDG